MKPIMDAMNNPARGTPEEQQVMKKFYLLRSVGPLGAPAVAWLNSCSLDQGTFYTESLRPIIDGAVNDWNENCANSEWSLTLLEEAKQVQLLSTSLIGQHTYTGSTSAAVTTGTASAHKRVLSELEDTASSGSESDDSDHDTKQTYFHIYKNKDGTRCKRSAKGKIVWKNSFELSITLKRMTEEGPKIYYNASSIINKTTDVTMVNQITTMTQWFQDRASDLKSKGLLKREKLQEQRNWRGNYGKSSRGSYRRNNNSW